MRRPGTKCLNCGLTLEVQDNFCPGCGQENTDQQVSMKTLIGEFLSNYFSFDSKLGRSLRSFFFKPGALTRCFNEGKRMHYIHPMRLYLVVTFLFFFVLSYLMMEELQNNTLQLIALKEPQAITEADSLALVNANKQLNEQIPSAPDLQLPSAPDYQSGTNKNDFKQILLLMADVRLSDEMVMDSLDISNSNRTSENFQLFFHQGRRVAQKDLDVFIPYVIKNLPIMMFILLPVFAFYLMYLFRNRPNLYIRHIIHSLHIHSMAFFLLTVYMLIGWLFGIYYSEIIFILITLYAFFSIKNVYQQAWGRTIWKFLLLGMLYFSSFLVFVFLELALSFLTF